MATKGETMEGSQSDTATANSPINTLQENVKVSFAAPVQAAPVLSKQNSLDDEVFAAFQINENDKTPKSPTADLPPPPPPPDTGGGDNVSIANSEVILRNPLMSRQMSRDGYKSGTPSMKQSHSASDLLRMRNPHNRNSQKDPKSMVLPISPACRSRNPFMAPSFPHSPSYDGLNFMAHPYASNPNLTALSTPQEQFAPYVPGNGLIYQNGGYPNGGYIVSSGDFEPHTPQSRRPLTPLTSSSSHHKLPTPPEAKKKLFTAMLTTSLSIIYAILIVIVGISFYVMDYLDLEDSRIHYLAEGFSLAVLGTALLYLMFLNIDITIYMSKRKRFDKLMETIQPEHMEMKETNEGVACDITLHKALSLRKQLDHRYCFNKDRHSNNFYLKIGAAGFCFGHLIHSLLILTYRGMILSNTDEDISEECLSALTFLIEVLYPIYSITLLFFIFKYSNVIINRNPDLHRFGFMHCVASSLCFWLWTIFRETAEYIQNTQTYNSTIESLEDPTTTDMGDYRKLGMLVPFRFTAICEHDEMNVIYQNFSPYLYPFSVEYSILVVGILYLVWVNIGLCLPSPSEQHGHEPEHDDHNHEDTRECRVERRPSEPESNLAVHADCHASNKGIFGGFIVLVFAIVSLILFFITFYNEGIDLAENGLVINQSTRTVIIAIMIIAVVFAYFQMIKLDVNLSAHTSLDNFLCLMCKPAFFVHGIFSIIPAILFGNVLASIGTVFEITQVIIQTAFIMDGMCRASNTKELRKKKFGREFVIFLVISNVAMWIMQTFEVKAHGLDQYRQDFYSKEFWSIVGHMCLPLMMFYRFHASVCIGDIWKYAYMPSGH